MLEVPWGRCMCTRGVNCKHSWEPLKCQRIHKFKSKLKTQNQSQTSLLVYFEEGPGGAWCSHVVQMCLVCPCWRFHGAGAYARGPAASRCTNCWSMCVQAFPRGLSQVDPSSDPSTLCLHTQLKIKRKRKLRLKRGLCSSLLLTACGGVSLLAFAFATVVEHRWRWRVCV